MEIWIAGLAFSAGLAAMLCEHTGLSRPLAALIHASFALTTTAAIAVVLIAGAWSRADRPPDELYRFTRLVSRWVYIGVYVLALVRVTLSPRSLDDFGFYVTACIVPLWSFRAWVLSARLQSLNN